MGRARVCGFRFEKGGMVLETMIWVAVIVIAAILEGMSAQLISIWFVGGGIAGMIAQLCGAPVWLQVLIAAVVTLVLLLATRPLGGADRRCDGGYR